MVPMSATLLPDDNSYCFVNGKSIYLMVKRKLIYDSFPIKRLKWKNFPEPCYFMVINPYQPILLYIVGSFFSLISVKRRLHLVLLYNLTFYPLYIVGRY